MCPQPIDFPDASKGTEKRVGRRADPENSRVKPKHHKRTYIMPRGTKKTKKQSPAEETTTATPQTERSTSADDTGTVPPPTETGDTDTSAAPQSAAQGDGDVDLPDAPQPTEKTDDDVDLPDAPDADVDDIEIPDAPPVAPEDGESSSSKDDAPGAEEHPAGDQGDDEKATSPAEETAGPHDADSAEAEEEVKEVKGKGKGKKKTEEGEGEKKTKTGKKTKGKDEMRDEEEKKPKGKGKGRAKAGGKGKGKAKAAEENEAKGDETGADEEKTQEDAEDADITSRMAGLRVGGDGRIEDAEGKAVGQVVKGDVPIMKDATVHDQGRVKDNEGKVIGEWESFSSAGEAGSSSKANETSDQEPKTPETSVEDYSILAHIPINKAGNIVNNEGRLLARVVEGKVQRMIGRSADDRGLVWNDTGAVIGRVELLPEDEREVLRPAPFANFPDATVDKKGDVVSQGEIVGKIIEGNPKKLRGARVDEDGDVIQPDGTVVGKAVLLDDPEPEEPEEVDLSALEGKRVTKLGYVISDDGILFGKLTEGDAEEVAGRPVDGKGQVWGDAGNVVGRAELVPLDQRKKVTAAPFEDFPNAIVQKDGSVLSDKKGEVIGRLIEGDAKKLSGKKVDASGDVLNKVGNVVGKAERYEPEEEEEVVVDRSALAGKRVNKAGFLVDGSGTVFGKLVEGEAAALVGKTCNDKGEIYNDAGAVVGRADLLPEGQRYTKKAGPFAGFQGLKVHEDGLVKTAEGEVVGKVTEGDGEKLRNRAVDEDGDILSAEGNVEGHVERYELPTEAPEEKPAGPLRDLVVNGEGKVFRPDGTLVAMLTEGDVRRCAGKKIDDDNDVLDRKGKVIGHVTLMEDIPAPETNAPPPTPEPAVEDDEKEEVDDRPKSLLDGCTVTADGGAYNAQGQLMGKLTDGKTGDCAGKRVNEHGLVLDNGGNAIGRVTLLSELPTEPPAEGTPVPTEEPQEEEDPAEVEKREKLERDRKLAVRMSGVIQRALDKIRPILRQITAHLDNAAQVQPEELDEEKLVKIVKPLIQQASACVEDTLKEIEAMDPTGEARQNARNPDSREPTKEERYLSSLIVELTQDVMGTIDNAKSVIADMPHAKKELEPHLDLLGGFLSKLLTGVLLVVSSILELVTGLLGGVLNVGGILGNLNLGGLVGGLTSGLTGALGGVLGGVTSQK